MADTDTYNGTVRWNTLEIVVEQSGAPAPGLRNITRASVCEHVATEALRLFDERGFDETTVEDIAAAVGMSSRSFFRYFAAKEDVVIADPVQLGSLVRHAAETRPSDEPIWVVLRQAFVPIESAIAAAGSNGLRAMRVMVTTPSLRARNVEKHIAWAAMVEPTIVERLDGPGETKVFRARIFIHSALACLDVALAEWICREGSTSMSQLLDQAFDTTRGLVHG